MSSCYTVTKSHQIEIFCLIKISNLLWSTTAIIRIVKTLQNIQITHQILMSVHVYVKCIHMVALNMALLTCAVSGLTEGQSAVQQDNCTETYCVYSCCVHCKPKYQKRTLLTVQYNSANKVHYIWKSRLCFLCFAFNKNISVKFKNTQSLMLKKVLKIIIYFKNSPCFNNYLVPHCSEVKNA